MRLQNWRILVGGLFLILCVSLKGETPSSILQYIQDTQAAYGASILSLQSANNASEAAAGLIEFVEKMEKVLATERELNQKFPAFQQKDDFQREINQRGFMVDFAKWQQLFAQAREKYKDDPAFQAAEKRMVGAGLFGKN
ncbi:MAG: hypothetical protein K8S54_12800 [Spirochaetia bacterium]|nr:hypothetical protein [Spirochaetia bacterium]